MSAFRGALAILAVSTLISGDFCGTPENRRYHKKPGNGTRENDYAEMHDDGFMLHEGYDEASYDGAAYGIERRRRGNHHYQRR